MSDQWRPDPVRVCARCLDDLEPDAKRWELAGRTLCARCHGLTLRERRLEQLQLARDASAAVRARKSAETNGEPK